MAGSPQTKSLQHVIALIELPPEGYWLLTSSVPTIPLISNNNSFSLLATLPLHVVVRWGRFHLDS